MKNKAIAGQIPAPSRVRARRGFTLLEILLATCILAVLAYLAIASQRMITSSLDRSVCSANLRQIGVAILNYANDHDGTLPGPVLAGQRAIYDKSSGHLARYIHSYLNCPPPPESGIATADIFKCPVQKRISQNPNDTPVYYLCRKTRFIDGTDQQPFGYAASGVVHALPMKLQGLLNQSGTVAMLDTLPAGAPPDYHGTGRNVLFLDGRVEHLGLDRLQIESTFVTIR